MRLTETDILSIQRSAEKIFGRDVHVFLFGSRVDDTLKGGDIDLLVKTEQNQMTGRNKVLFLVELKKQIGDQKIDVVYDKVASTKNIFLESIRKQAVQLC